MAYSKLRPQSRKYLDGDCPKGVLAIYDNGDTSADRYTVFYRAITYATGSAQWIGYRGMSEHPQHPQGAGMYGEMTLPQVYAYRKASRRQACQWTALPDDVRKLVIADCADL